MSYAFGPFRYDVPLVPKVVETPHVLLWPDTVVEESGLARNSPLGFISRSHLHMPSLQIPAAIGALHVICWYFRRIQ
ncbi:MAG: hypothetical protein P4L56_15775 [Candidatus Sulfopaludibacter sp.]|nr:hypothetical protein [Candidatus Sulfopaludibacter sp.]